MSTRFGFRRAIVTTGGKGLLLTMILTALIVIGCDGGMKQGGEHEDTVRQATVTSMRDTGDFRSAVVDTKQCMISAGYLNYESESSAGGFTLLDGTRYQPGSSRPTQAVVEFLYAREQCYASSGLNAVVGANGLADPTPNPVRQQGLNEAKLRQAQCLESKGWELGTPRLLHGSLTFPEPDTAEAQAAFRTDMVKCNQELWNSLTLGGSSGIN